MDGALFGFMDFVGYAVGVGGLSPHGKTVGGKRFQVALFSEAYTRMMEEEARAIHNRIQLSQLLARQEHARQLALHQKLVATTAQFFTLLGEV